MRSCIHLWVLHAGKPLRSPLWWCLLVVGKMCGTGHSSSVLGLNHQNDLRFLLIDSWTLYTYLFLIFKKITPGSGLLQQISEYLFYFRPILSKRFLFIVAQFLFLAAICWFFSEELTVGSYCLCWWSIHFNLTFLASVTSFCLGTPTQSPLIKKWALWTSWEVSLVHWSPAAHIPYVHA